MPFSYAASRPQVRVEILRRIAGGERLKHICAEPGMPCQESVNGWMRRDRWFAERVRRARARADYRRRWRFDEAKAQAIVEALAAGRSIEEIVRGPGMPSYKVYMRWRGSQPEFAQAVERVIAARMAGRGRKRFRPYDPAIGEEIYVRLWKGETLRALLRSERRFPSLMVFARWRRESREFDALMKVVIGGWRKKGRGPRLLTEDLQEEIVSRIVEGGSLRSISLDPAMPCQGTLSNWVRDRPAFAHAVAQACEEREHWYYDHVLEIAQAATPATVKAAEAAISPFKRQLARLRKRPGWKQRLR
jgi:hypothetical protein